MAIFRAFLRNLFSGEIVQGGSTITQQVVKSILLTPEKSFSRKFREAILAFKMENNLSKDEILFLYLNQIFLGHGAYGVAAAARTYFGKEIDGLNLAESALLAGLPQAPSKNSPFHHPELARRRQAYILQRMAEEGFISKSEMGKALQVPMDFKRRQLSVFEKAPHFAEYIKKYVEEKYGKEALYTEGLQVYTTLDISLQKAAEEALEGGLKEIEKRQNIPGSLEGALICFDLETGYVKAMVGGRDFNRSQFNRVTQARRQTGSAFKPIVYASALDRGYTPASIIVDAPIIFEWEDKRWKPRNFEKKFHGPMTLRSALTHSVNIVTVKIAQEIGIDSIQEYARKLGISFPLQDDLSMALGSSSISLYELAKGYAVFANQGKAIKPIFIRKILDRDGNLLEENLPPFHRRGLPQEEPVINPQTAYVVTRLLEGVVQNGTGWRAKALGRPVAAKTGTTDHFLDAWFIGYTAEVVTGVWVGFDEERSIGENETGARAASPIWVKFMSKILKDRPVKDFPMAEGVEFMKVDGRTGQPSLDREGTLECFKGGTSPNPATSARVKTGDFFKSDIDYSVTK
jgi:penicillin-binding protein 1A